jgi:hypothetical protein
VLYAHPIDADFSKDRGDSVFKGQATPLIAGTVSIRIRISGGGLLALELGLVVADC